MAHKLIKECLYKTLDEMFLRQKIKNIVEEEVINERKKKGKKKKKRIENKKE